MLLVVYYRWGATLPATIAKRTAGKAAGKAVAKRLSPIDDAAKYIDKKLSDTAQSIKFGKEGKRLCLLLDLKTH